MPSTPESLRVLCLDGGGIKGYTSLLILKRIFRTMMAEGELEEIPKPCDVFDLIVGTSTGGLIAVMLGRLHMTIDDCIAKYEQVGKEVFGKKPQGGKLGKVFKGLRSSSFYDIEVLQEEVRKLLDSKGMVRNTPFCETGTPSCKVVLCVTRSEITKPDVLRNYISLHPTAENYSCTIWEAASATAAAPLYFKAVQFNDSGEKWCDGGLRRNNPINEGLSELSRERDWKNKKIGCILSIGTGVKSSGAITSSLSSVLKGAVAIMSDSDDVARVFASSELGIELFRTHRYFRFSVPQGMQDLQLDDWKETERMRALATDYLGHTANSDMLTTCAKSLSDPDENLQIDINTKLSLIPYRPCTHFIDRRAYSDALLQFFRSKAQRSQTYVQWGLGGIGKTQIALKFAQTVKHRFSVFWIRADRFVNFATDYGQVLRELDPQGAQGLQSIGNFSSILHETRRKLEEKQNEWLLILDNADDLDAFLGRGQTCDDNEGLSISMFLPRHGRMLITTRDRRFQGTVAAANDGMKVTSMSEDEATELLVGSIPGYLIREGPDSTAQANELVEELGYLPLAIAQAAANILENQLTLSDYVSFYRDKKQRMGLMQTPAQDFQTTDPRNASQSVNITWQISFDGLKEKHPLSVVFLTYVACFHWRNIPRVLIQGLPDFRDLPESQFIQLTKKPLNLSLLEEEEVQPGFTEFLVHPLVHENIIAHTPPAEMNVYLQRLVDLVVTIFPLLEERRDEGWPIAVYLGPHVIRMIGLCDDIQLSSKTLSILLKRASKFHGISNLFTVAVELAERAKTMGQEVWVGTPEVMVSILSNLSSQYVNASKKEEAEQTAREALEWLDSDSVQANMEQNALGVYRIQLQSSLAITLTGKAGNEEREKLHRMQLASGLVDEWGREGVTIRHNLAHALYHQQKYEEAQSLNRTLIEYAQTERGKQEVARRVYLTMLNLSCQITRGHVSIYDQEGVNKLVGYDSNKGPTPQQLEQIQIHRLVLNESIDQLGLEDADTWIATNNLTAFLSMHLMWEECGEVLWQMLPAGIVSKVRAEGRFNTTLEQISRSAQEYLESLERSSSQDATIVEGFRSLLEQWIVSSGCTGNLPNFPWITNSRGVDFQRLGRFEEAEREHRETIKRCQERDENIDAVYHYNLMISIGRQPGRIEEAVAYREAHQADLVAPEAAFGTMEERVERDNRDREIYDEAQELMDRGHLKRESEWWLERNTELKRAELRYGELRPRPVLESQTPHKENVGKKKVLSKLSRRFKPNHHLSVTTG